jgi:cation:H+ antiporter
MFILWIIIFIVSLAVLVKSSDYFTESAEKIGLYFGLSTFLVGMTIVAIGTSLPELLTAIFGVLSGVSEIAVSNVIGSNVVNILFGIGILPLLVGDIKITKDLIRVDLPILIGSVFMIAATCLDGILTFPEALILFVSFLVYIGYSFAEHKTHGHVVDADVKKEKLNTNTFLVLIGSGVALYFGAKYVIDSVLYISKALGWGVEVITASAISLGTSLPEIVTSAMAARKKKWEMAIGTLIGSNIFNAFAVLGISGLFGSLVVSSGMISFGVYFLVAATLLFLFIAQDNEITKWEGLILILFYILFIGKLFRLF